MRRKPHAPAAVRREIRKRFRVLRAERDLTQPEVAVKADIGFGRYLQIEHGHVEPSDEELKRLARVLGVEPTQVLPATIHDEART